MSIKHNLEQWIAQLDYDDTCDISDRQVSELIRGYSTLEAKCAALAAENAALKESEREFDKMCAEEFGPDWVSEFTETPSTDSFLAEVRAQGVEMLREHPAIQLCSLTHVCDELADQLRQGGEA
jgi:hypothetical protein